MPKSGKGSSYIQDFGPGNFLIPGLGSQPQARHNQPQPKHTRCIPLVCFTASREPNRQSCGHNPVEVHQKLDSAC